MDSMFNCYYAEGDGEMSKMITTVEDVFNMLDTLLQDNLSFKWDTFYSNRERDVPFFINKPDENLVHYLEHQMIPKGTILDLGCGPGRNAIYLAKNGFTVDALDSSQEAIVWAREQAAENEAEVNFLQGNMFQLELKNEFYDVVYDSGCLHHIAPHRRISYLELLNKVLKPKGFYALTCFVEGGDLGGSELSDLEVYRERSLQGGLGFTEDKLKNIFEDLKVIQMRRMIQVPDTEPVFGVSGLWTALFQKQG